MVGDRRTYELAVLRALKTGRPLPGSITLVDMPRDWLGIRMTLYRLAVGFGAGFGVALWLM